MSCLLATAVEEVWEWLPRPLCSIIAEYARGLSWAIQGPLASPWFEISADGKTARPKDRDLRAQSMAARYIAVIGSDSVRVGQQWFYRCPHTPSQSVWFGIVRRRAVPNWSDQWTDVYSYDDLYAALIPPLKTVQANSCIVHCHLRHSELLITFETSNPPHVRRSFLINFDIDTDEVFPYVALLSDTAMPITIGE